MVCLGSVCGFRCVRFLCSFWCNWWIGLLVFWCCSRWWMLLLLRCLLRVLSSVWWFFRLGFRVIW